MGCIPACQWYIFLKNGISPFERARTWLYKKTKNDFDEIIL
jgi:nitrate reductase alpha subunit